MNDKMREALEAAARVIRDPDSPISDTLWASDSETLLDMISAALAQQPESKPELPNEQGTNRYGLDMAYFRNLINRDLNSHSLDNYKPSELARVFARMAAAADRDVLRESEFSGPQPAPQVPEGLVEKALQLCVAVENEDDLPPVKYALRAVRLINEIKSMCAAAPSIAEEREEVERLWAENEELKEWCRQYASVAAKYTGNPCNCMAADGEHHAQYCPVWVRDNAKLNISNETSPTAPSIAEERGPEATLFHLDDMEYTVESAQDVAEYHGDNMPLNSSELVSVDRFHQLPSRDMRVTVDADGHMEWQWLPTAPHAGGE